MKMMKIMLRMTIHRLGEEKVFTGVRRLERIPRWVVSAKNDDDDDDDEEEEEEEEEEEDLW